jgi:dipeptidyl aminopeptidase/acylaminoacyl peptidase
MQEALSARGIRSTLMILGDEGHGARKRNNQVLEIGNVVRFFDEHLKGPRSP